MSYRNAVAVFVLCLSISGCDSSGFSVFDRSPKVPKFQTVEAIRTIDTMKTIIGDQSSIIAVCGESQGVGYYRSKEGFVKDGISGQFGIVRLENGRYDVYFSDSMSGFRSITEDGGIVSRISEDGNPIILNILYKSGLNLSYALSGSGRDAKAIYVAVKPSFEFIETVPERAQLFVSSCILLDENGVADFG